ncbi:hypothetical protein BCR39DRAFT_533850 [Naematelia encephala]|uniref:Uncharacterized protein n=1 Tax=Naematelia encephala TaxID=71784 RepID=A0A1Y2B220_9TREE|nr:hypothetical protein BCR39DRAFT_533850 [Naematelia encephala]
MSLSSSTLNLKFMQRALARQAPSTPKSTSTSTPISTSTPLILPSSTKQSGSLPPPPATPTPAPNTTIGTATPVGQSSTPQTSGPNTSAALAEEEAARWFLPLPTSSFPSASSSRLVEKDRVRIENSYLPFLETGEGSWGGGGGRMRFGYGGDSKDDEEGEGGEEGDDGDGEERHEQGEGDRRGTGQSQRGKDEGEIRSARRDQARSQTNPRPSARAKVTETNRGVDTTPRQGIPNTPSGAVPNTPSNARTFLRPQGLTEHNVPSIPRSNFKKPDSTTIEPTTTPSRNAGNVKQLSSQVDKNNDDNDNTPRSKGPKKRKLDSLQSQPQPPSNSQKQSPPQAQSQSQPRPQLVDQTTLSPTNPSPATNGGLDDRERELKAAKRREKKARKRAKAAAGGTETV